MQRLYVPSYSVSEAARYAQTPRSSVSYWHYSPGPGPLLPGKAEHDRLSYLQLVEVAFVAGFRRCGVKLPAIRRARAYLCERFQTDYPFAFHKFMTDGVHVLVDLEKWEKDEAGPTARRVIVTDEGGQLAWHRILADRFKEFVYEDSLALKWFVRGKESPILIDPRVAFGTPSVRGVPTWAIKESWKAGESLEGIQGNYQIPENEIRVALEFENVPLAA